MRFLFRRNFSYDREIILSVIKRFFSSDCHLAKEPFTFLNLKMFLRTRRMKFQQLRPKKFARSPRNFIIQSYFYEMF